MTRLTTGEIDGLRVLGPVATILSMAHETPHEELVELLEAVVTPSRRYPGLRLPRRPHASVDDLRAFAATCRRMRGVAAFRAAADDVRVGVDSPPETRTRRVIVRAGLPEPTVQHAICIDGVRIATVDLAYPQWRIALEYEGDQHLTDPVQWADDIRRYERLEALGWIVIRVTKGDLRGDASALLHRLRTAIARRSA